MTSPREINVFFVCFFFIKGKSLFHLVSCSFKEHRVMFLELYSETVLLFVLIERPLVAEITHWSCNAGLNK